MYVIAQPDNGDVIVFNLPIQQPGTPEVVLADGIQVRVVLRCGDEGGNERPALIGLSVLLQRHPIRMHRYMLVVGDNLMMVGEARAERIAEKFIGRLQRSLPKNRRNDQQKQNKR